MIYRKKYEKQRKSDVLTLQEGIEELLKYYRLKGKFNQTNVVASWERIMGKTIASRTEKIFFKDQKLFVKITSAPLKHHLSTQKEKVVDLVNKELGEEVVKEIVFL
jgi:hypothetical protein